MAPAGIGHMQPLRVIIMGDSAIQAAAALSDTGSYVAVDIRNVDTNVADAPADETSDDDSSGMRLYQSLYETALRNNVPKAVIEDLVRIYSYDVDFQRKVQPGDNFDVLYADDENGEGHNEVRFAVALRRRRDQEVLSFPDRRRRRLRLLRRGRKEREEIPGAQARRRRHGDVAVRLAHPSDAARQRTAHRRRLGCAVRHADLRRRHRHDRGNRAQRRLRQICQHQTPERL